MTKPERRRVARRKVKLPVVLTTVSGSFVAQTLDVSPDGALVRVRGPLTVLLDFEGRQYRGRLVRTLTTGSDTGDFGIQLYDPVPWPTSSVPG